MHSPLAPLALVVEAEVLQLTLRVPLELVAAATAQHQRVAEGRLEHRLTALVVAVAAHPTTSSFHHTQVLQAVLLRSPSWLAQAAV